MNKEVLSLNSHLLYNQSPDVNQDLQVHTFKPLTSTANTQAQETAFNLVRKKDRK